MWMFFEDGTFYSAVVVSSDTKMLCVRSRDEVSAQKLADFSGEEVIQLEKRDYAYRSYVSRGVWDDFVSDKIHSAKATNFKTQVSRNTGWDSRIMDALHDIWSVMFRYQSDVKSGVKRKKSYTIEMGARNEN